ncbi:MAG: hypothetical protein JO204_12330, partial [Alphaproteobacteria bacterium]|nr:hypothetical protein [Alphaproteobacteria bacterium]
SHYLFQRFIDAMAAAKHETADADLARRRWTDFPLAHVEPHEQLLKQPADAQKLYKIVRVPYLIDMLKRNYLYFQRVDKYTDDTYDGEQLPLDREQNEQFRFEKSPDFTVARYHDSSRGRTYACCFSIEESEYLWEEYGKHRDVVCLVFEFGKLRQVLNRTLRDSIEHELLVQGDRRLKQMLSINYGIVEYISRDEARLNISRIANPIQYTFLKEKRKYEKEQELRISLSALGVGNFDVEFPNSVEMGFDYKTAFAEGIIEQIDTKPGYCDTSQMRLLTDEMQALGYGIRERRPGSERHLITPPSSDDE